jgi:hypothetical protein
MRRDVLLLCGVLAVKKVTYPASSETRRKRVTEMGSPIRNLIRVKPVSVFNCLMNWED